MADLRTGDIVQVRLPDESWSYGVLVDVIYQTNAVNVPSFYYVRVRHGDGGTPIKPKTLWLDANRVTSYDALCAWGGPVDWVEKELIQS